MADNDFAQLLDDLRAKKIDHFDVTPEDFQDFQPVFHAYTYRSQIEGKAHSGGTITYQLKQR